MPFSNNTSGIVGQGVKNFSISEALSFGFNIWKNNLGLFAIAILAAILVYVLPGLIGSLIGIPADNKFLQVITSILMIAIEMGFIKIYLKLYDNRLT